MTGMNKNQLRNIVEHDYHQLSFSKEKFLNEVIEALKLKKIVKTIYDRHGISCDCGFCECLRKERLKK